MDHVAPMREDPDLEGLRPADRTAALRPYLYSVWERRDYIWHVARGRLQSQQMDTVLGNVWHLLNPMLNIAVYYVIFELVLGVNRGVPNFIAFLAVGLFPFQFTQRATMAGARSITSNENLLRSIWFPRAILPATSTAAEAMAFLPTVGVMLGVCLVTGESPLLTWLVVPAFVALQVVFNLAIALVMARVSNSVPDIQKVLPFVFQLLRYASGVIFLLEAYVEDSSWRLLFELNPLYSFVSLWRWAVLGYDVNLYMVVVGPVATVLLFIFGFWWFRNAEREYGRG